MNRPDFTRLDHANIVAFIGDIFERRGADSYLGEQVTMSEHMLQGALLAEEAGASDALVAGALLHDIGHYTNEFPEDALAQGIDNHHDTAGAAVLAPFFPKVVTDCVLHHVGAKRFDGGPGFCIVTDHRDPRQWSTHRDSFSLPYGHAEVDDFADQRDLSFQILESFGLVHLGVVRQVN